MNGNKMNKIYNNFYYANITLNIRRHKENNKVFIIKNLIFDNLSAGIIKIKSKKIYILKFNVLHDP